MLRILVTLCILSFAMAGKRGYHGPSHSHHGLSRRDNSEIPIDSASLEDRNESDGDFEPVQIDDEINPTEPTVSAENPFEPSIAEDNELIEPNLSAEKGTNSNEPKLSTEDIGQDTEKSKSRVHLAKDDILDVKRYEAELAAGDPTQFRGTNQHYHDPHFYKDLGRRFVPVYPYKEVKKAKSQKRAKYFQDDDLVPIWAPPEVVLAVMKEALKNRPPKNDEYFDRQKILRSGDYFDGVWKEEIKTDDLLQHSKTNALRSGRNKAKQSQNRHQHATDRDAELNASIRYEVPKEFRFINYPPFTLTWPRSPRTPQKIKFIRRKFL